MLIIGLDVKILCQSILGSDLFDTKLEYHHIYNNILLGLVPYETIVTDLFLTIILLLPL